MLSRFKIDLSFHFIQVSLDAAMNLPWSNFTHASMCLNPPGALYMVCFDHIDIYQARPVFNAVIMNLN